MGINYTKHCLLKFGMYVQTHDEPDNSMKSCTTGAIALQLTGNQQGSFFFYNLNTGCILNHKHNDWTILPMPTEVIDRVHALAAMANSPNGIIFDEYEDNDDDPDDHSYHPNNDDDNQDFPLAPNHFTPIAGVNDGLDDDDPPTLPLTAIDEK